MFFVTVVKLEKALKLTQNVAMNSEHLEKPCFLPWTYSCSKKTLEIEKSCTCVNASNPSVDNIDGNVLSVLDVLL